MSSTSLSLRKGWFPWSFTLKTTEIPPGAVHVVADVPVVLLHRFHRCAWSKLCSILWWLCSFFWLVFFGPCTQVHGQGSPAIRAGKEWRGRRELAPRCSATQKGAWSARAWTDTPCGESSEPPTPLRTTTHHHHHPQVLPCFRVTFADDLSGRCLDGC